MKFKKTPTNKLTRFSIVLAASLLLLLVVIDSKVLAAGIYGNALASDILSGKTATTDAGSITGTLALTGNMVASDLLAGKTGYSNNPATKLTGTIPNYTGDVAGGAATTTGGDLYITPAAGYYNGSARVYQYDNDLRAANITSGVNIFGLTGTFATPHGSQTFSTAGITSFTVPNNVTSLMMVACGGGGGGGGGSTGNGGTGGGGGGSNIALIAVTPGASISVYVGAGGGGGAYGATGGAGGTSAVNGIGGGGGYGGPSGNVVNGGAGGAGGGAGGAGERGEGGISGYGYGRGGWSGLAGAGGAYFQNPTAGSAPGGGGGGGIANSGAGLAGGVGRVILYW